LIEALSPSETAPWRSLQARVARGEGDQETASRLAGEELALTGDEVALREAVALLEPTSARLERAKAHAALGERRVPLELDQQCGADGLAARLRSF
jgi:hypothetical protein